ncbi:hypothetical protein [Streptomyces sp. IB201691-2A2]|uniref:hypothetical protein n=1 Tax=Streptomyces sp. IB201691-2A2 TaxID=2561920 RepID=UPI00117DB397|nr:hypothetical protein [Streptomyces sp. IB201691-2A2]TRO58044.1 hypothetical protein E4K73_40890 [Streptomyces sp. IB201691-2A2]
MTITAGAPPTHSTPAALARGFLTGGVAGTSLAALVVGGIIERVPLFVAGLVVPAVYGLLLFLAGAPRRAREAAVVPRTALAMIESLKAIGGESSDVPVRFDLTVAPDDEPAYRVEITQDINLVDLPDYRPRGILVVQYPPDRPWRVRIVKRPPLEWEERAAGARLDSVPGPATVSEPPEGCAFGFVVLLGLLLGAAAVIGLFRADLFDEDATARPSSSSKPSAASSSSTSSTTVVSSASGTVALGPGQSMLDKGELRRAVDSLIKGKGMGEGNDKGNDKGEGKNKRAALTVVVQERLLSVVFSPTGTQAPQFDPGSLPYERFPALVEEARTTLGIRSPQTWQITADRLTGSLTIRVGVTGPEGAASLEADGQGKVVRRTPAG